LPFISRIQKQNEDGVDNDGVNDGVNDGDGVDAGSDDVKNMNGGGGDGVLKEVGEEDGSGKDGRIDDGDGDGSASSTPSLDAIEITAKVVGDGDTKVNDGQSADIEQAELDALTAFVWGISCGTASCATLRNSVFDLEIAQTLYSQLNIEQLS